MTSDANGLATWETPAGGGINNVVEDTTPQLGGDLDGNGNDIDLSTGNLVLALNSSSHIQRSGTRFLHSSGGSGNTFLGPDAGNFTLTGGSNTGVGDRALTNNTGGAANTAVGHLALSLNTIGINNTAVGDQALRFNTVGSTNTAVGVEALEGNTTGVNNVGLGYRSGIVNTTGSNNIYLGANINAVNTESTTTRLGHQTTQTRTFIAGIRGKTTGVADAVTVMIDSAGQLGTVSSSLRYKFDVKDMGDVTAALMRLRPVTFRYKHVFAGGAQPLQYGLIAEEVAEIFPDLVVFNEDGLPETVQYRKVNAMLLNEVQNLHRQNQAQQTVIDDLMQRLTALEAVVGTAAVSAQAQDEQ